MSATWHELLVRGEADGFDPSTGVLEEVKTSKVHLDLLPANKRALHWAQAKVYGSLLCQQLALPNLRVCLVYLDVDTHDETTLEERCTALELLVFFEDLCQRFVSWAQSERAHRKQRDDALGRLTFVHAGFRPGQRSLAENTFRAARLRRWLLAQATTGIGKTIATLFSLLKAMPLERLDKIFFLTAGDHLDPAATKKHGEPWGDGHLGDLPALYVAADGSATNPVLAPRLKLDDVRNRALMVHLGGVNHADHPALLGGGGARVVCGVSR